MPSMPSRSREAGIRHFGNINLRIEMIFNSERFEFSLNSESGVPSWGRKVITLTISGSFVFIPLKD